MTPKFKVGEQCIYKPYGQKATIKALDLTHDQFKIYYWIMFDEQWFPDMFVSEDELEESLTELLPYGKSLQKKNSKVIRCECGAHKTASPDCHSYRCPEYKSY